MSTQNDGNDGGPAAQMMLWDGKQWQPLMSLRDWFAGQALCGFIACSETTGSAEDFATRSYAHADAMLKARGK